MAQPNRKAERYNTFIPVDVEVNGSGETLSQLTIANLSAGGIGFRAPKPIFIGTPLTLTFNKSWPDYVIRGEVAWCRARGGQYEIGVIFERGNEAFKARMLTQFGQIERYRLNVLKNEGRQLDCEEAAREWIELYAETFAQSVGW